MGLCEYSAFICLCGPTKTTLTWCSFADSLPPTTFTVFSPLFCSKTRGVGLSYVPVLWINGVAEIDSRIGDMFQDQIEIPLGIINGFHYALYGVGPAMALLPVACYIRQWRRKKQQRLGDGNGHTPPDTTSERALIVNNDTGPAAVRSYNAIQT